MKVTTMATVFVLLITLAAVGQDQRMSSSMADLAKGSLSSPVSGESALTPEARLSDFAQLSRVSDTLYELGPGDVLSIMAVGVLDKAVQVPVTAEGKVVLPYVGEIVVTGMTLAISRQLIVDRLSKVFRNASISVALIRLRTFRVYITGEVSTPGARQVTGVTRVSDLIEKSVGGVNTPRYRRAIQILQGDVLVGYADLARFYNRGDIRANPFLKEGMVVHVPKFGDVVRVTGAVNYDGVFDFVPGDTLGALIASAGGFTEAADSTRLLLARFGTDGYSIDTMTLTTPLDMSKPLVPGDRITVASKPRYHKALSVLVQGEVKYPGVYPIRKDLSTISDLIDLAGGVTDDAFLSGSYIIRSRDSLLTRDFSKDPNAFLAIIRSLPIDPGSIRPEEATYMRAALTENGERMLVDVAKALQDRHGKNDVVLCENDLVVVSRKNANIQVWGAVASPGLVGFEADKTIDYYVRMAGGFSKYAAKYSVLVRKSGTTSWVAAGGGIVAPGDAILVPENKYRDSFVFTRDMFNLAASALGIVASALTILVLAKSL